MSRRHDPGAAAPPDSRYDGATSTYHVPERFQEPSRADAAEAHRRRVAAALIEALEIASAAPATPPDPRKTWEKLQFDWPDVSAAELDALRLAVVAGGPLSLDAFPLTTQLLSAVEEGATAQPPQAQNAQPGGEVQQRRAESWAKRVAYQHLAAALFTSVLTLLQMTEEDATARLCHLAGPVSGADDEGMGLEEPEVGNGNGIATGAPFASKRDGEGGSDSSDWEDIPIAPQIMPASQPTAGLPADLGSKMKWLLSHFSWTMLDLPGVWSEAKLTGVALSMLRALGNTHRDAAWGPHVRMHISFLLKDRWCSSPEAASDPQLPDVLKLLTAESGQDAQEKVLPLWMLAALADQSNGVGCACWPQLHSCMEPVIAPLTERLTQSAPSNADAIMHLGDIMAGYALHAPGGSDVGGTLLRTGVLRTAAALLTHSNVPLDLRRGVLLVVARCARNSAAASFVANVPGVNTTMAGPDGDALGGIWHLLYDGKDSAVCHALLNAAQRGDYAADRHAMSTLTLLHECMRATAPATPLWRHGDAVHTALLCLQSSLRGAQTGEAPKDEATDELSAADKARVRRATLRGLVKEVLAHSDGTSRKKD